MPVLFYEFCSVAVCNYNKKCGNILTFETLERFVITHV